MFFCYLLLLHKSLDVLYRLAQRLAQHHNNNIKMENSNRTYDYFDDVISINDLDLDNISLGEKRCKCFTL